MTAELRYPQEKTPYLIWRGDTAWVAKDVETSIASQGDSPEEALKNLREALELYYRKSEVPDEELETVEMP